MTGSRWASLLGCLVMASVLVTVGLAPAAQAQERDVVAGEVIAIDRESPQHIVLAVAVPDVPPGAVPTISLQPDLATSDASVVRLDQPPTVVFAFDRSGSMEGRRLELAKTAAAQCLDRLPENSTLALIVFDDQAEVVEALTTDPSRVVSAIDEIVAAGNTATFDAVIAATELSTYSEADSLSDRASRFLVLLSDGEDTASVATSDEAAARVLDSGFRLYALGVDTEDGGLESLEALVETTGGLALNGSAEELGGLCSSVAERIDGRFQISLEFVDVVPDSFTVLLEFDDVLVEIPVTPPRSIAAVLPSTSAIKTGPVDLGVRTGSAAIDSLTAAQLQVEDLAPDSEPVEPLLAPVVPTPVERLESASDVLWVASQEPDPRRLWLGAVLALAAPLVLWRTFGSSRRIVHGLRIRRLPTTGKLERLTSFAHGVLERREQGRVIDRKLELASVSLRAGEFVVFVGLAALVAAAALAFLGMKLSALVALVAVPAGSFMWVTRRGQRRSARFEEQLGDTLTILAGALRSGSSSMQALGIAASKAPSPTAEEFQRVISEVRIGRDLVAALRDMADRMQSEDGQWLVEAIALNRELGGNLAKTLDNVGETITARAQVKAQVAVMSAEGRLTAGILIGLPFFIALVLQVLNPGYIKPLLESGTGNVILAIALGNMTLGTVWIRKLIQMEY